MVAAIEGAIDIGHVVRLMELRRGQVSLAKLTLPEGDPLVGGHAASFLLAAFAMILHCFEQNFWAWLNV